jgi:hypothetical protein
MKRPGDAFNCDICDATKGTVNHWRVLTLGTVTVKKDGDEQPTEIRELKVSEWHPVLALADDASHACGNNCAQKLIERYLQHGTMEMQRVAGGVA